jgi:hypothetical protein
MPRRAEDIPAAGRDYYMRNKPRIQVYKRERHQKVKRFVRMAKYGLTPDDYERMAEEQNWCCAICGLEEWATRDGVLCVDHSHETGVVRGLLCYTCNLGLGHLHDSPELLEIARKYLLDRRMGT